MKYDLVQIRLTRATPLSLFAGHKHIMRKFLRWIQTQKKIFRPFRVLRDARQMIMSARCERAGMHGFALTGARPVGSCLGPARPPATVYLLGAPPVPRNYANKYRQLELK